MRNVSMNEINQLVGMQLGIREVSENSLLVEELGAESADVMNIVAALEEKYDIVVKETELARIRMSADLFTLVQMKLSDSSL
ncbi:MAG TPA: acyl carrier protein [Anaerolineae bacterium]|nr:acyl carrier protein [Anaerolineae bacterium]